MPKRNPPETTSRHKEAPAAASSRGPGAGSLLLFWPFHLFNLLTRPLRLPLKLLARATGYPIVAGLYVLAVFALVYGIRSQRYDLAKIHAMPERSIILDRLGEEIGRIHGEKRSVVPLRQVAENFRKAILAREDERFFKHGAIDPAAAHAGAIGPEEPCCFRAGRCRGRIGRGSCRRRARSVPP